VEVTSIDCNTGLLPIALSPSQNVDVTLLPVKVCIRVKRSRSGSAASIQPTMKSMNSSLSMGKQFNNDIDKYQSLYRQDLSKPDVVRERVGTSTALVADVL